MGRRCGCRCFFGFVFFASVAGFSQAVLRKARLAVQLRSSRWVFCQESNAGYGRDVRRSRAYRKSMRISPVLFKLPSLKELVCGVALISAQF